MHLSLYVLREKAHSRSQHWWGLLADSGEQGRQWPLWAPEEGMGGLPGKCPVGQDLGGHQARQGIEYKDPASLA